MLAPTHAAAQLMQLREAHALGVLDDHQSGVGYIDAHFDDGGRHQQVDFPVLEAAHGALLGRRPACARAPGRR